MYVTRIEGGRSGEYYPYRSPSLVKLLSRASLPMRAVNSSTYRLVFRIGITSLEVLFVVSALSFSCSFSFVPFLLYVFLFPRISPRCLLLLFLLFSLSRIAIRVLPMQN